MQTKSAGFAALAKKLVADIPLEEICRDKGLMNHSPLKCSLPFLISLPSPTQWRTADRVRLEVLRRQRREAAILVLTLHPEEYFTNNGSNTVWIEHVGGKNTRIAIYAPQEMTVLCGKVLEREGGKRPDCIKPGKSCPPHCFRGGNSDGTETRWFLLHQCLCAW